MKTKTAIAYIIDKNQYPVPNTNYLFIMYVYVEGELRTLEIREASHLNEYEKKKISGSLSQLRGLSKNPFKGHQ